MQKCHFKKQLFFDEYLEIKFFVQTHLKSIICPAPKLHDTSLLVKREIFNIHLENKNFPRVKQKSVVLASHLTGRMVNCGGFPGHIPGVVEGSLSRQGHLKIPIGTGNQNIISLYVYWNWTIVFHHEDF